MSARNPVVSFTALSQTGERKHLVIEIGVDQRLEEMDQGRVLGLEVDGDRATHDAGHGIHVGRFVPTVDVYFPQIALLIERFFVRNLEGSQKLFQDPPF